MHVLEVQVLVGGGGFFPLLPGRPSLVGGSLQVVLVVHFDRARQDVVHDHQPDVDAPRLDAVQPVELGQQCAGVLVEVLRGEKRLMSQWSSMKRDARQTQDIFVSADHLLDIFYIYCTSELGSNKVQILCYCT